MKSGRWVEVSASQFSHEAEGLRLVKELLPDAEPFRAWSNFEFRDNQGRWHEVDLLVLGRDTLYLVELKYYRGRLRGDDHRWLRDGYGAEDSPLKLAHRKAQYFATLLRTRLKEFLRQQGAHDVDVRKIVPFVQEAVFLHHENLQCELPAHSRQGLYGLEGRSDASGLEPISNLLLAPARHAPVTQRNSELLAGLMKKIGLVPRRQREVGSWIIDDEPLGDGDGWQDWPAFHRVATTDRYRIRFHIPRPGSTSAEELQLQRRIEHENRLLSKLHHDALQVPRDIIKDELGIGLVYEDDRRLTRLDLWFAEHGDGLPLTKQLDIIRQVAETLAYAHRHRVVHRGLTPSAVSIRERSGGGLAVVVTNWDAAGTIPAAGLSSFTSTGLGDDQPSPSPMASEFTDEEQLFEAPEGRWAVNADRNRLDVFALGTLAFYVLTNQTLPAQDRATLVERLRRDTGLDLAAELPQIPSALRDLVLGATDPRPAERTPTVAAFLRQLDEAEALFAAPTVVDEDPLEARPGAVLGGKFTYLQKLGSGSTAVGILVKDASAGDAIRVLKVAKDDAAAGRLAAEAKVLGKLNHERIVQLAYETKVGSREVLVLHHAGETTLADELALKRGRLSLDLLERWGTDLLDALTELDRVGISHRDIKPPNLGVRKVGKTETHLVLFDFSMASTGARALTAGTPPYLDPFLGQDGRITYDTAAERYGAAVVLYEMAAGKLPRYGSDPDANPATVADDVTLVRGAFDAAVEEDLESFFRAALSRDVTKRHDTAEDMRRAWRGIFRKLGRYGEDTDSKVAAATLDSTLVEAGLSARAISALEPLNVGTVADILTVDSTPYNRLLGKLTKTTGEEIRKRVKAWRKEFGTQMSGLSARGKTSRDGEPTSLPDPIAAAKLLASTAKSPRAKSRQLAAELILGLTDGLDPFASQTELATAVGSRSGPRGHQLIRDLQDTWSKHETPRILLDQLVVLLTGALKSLGGVATVQTLTAEILAALPEAPDETAGQSERAAAGLLRLALDRYNEHEVAEMQEPLAKRRHGGRLALLAKDAVLLDAAEAAGLRASELVAQATSAGEAVVTQQRAAKEIRAAFEEAFVESSTEVNVTPPAITDLRLVRLAAQTSRTVALSARGELHAHDLAPATAVALALAGLAESAVLRADELLARVRARFPQLDALPARPGLDAVVERAGVGLQFIDDAYRAPRRTRPTTTGLPTRMSSVVPERTEAALGRGDHLDRVFAESLSAHSFLALGVVVNRSDEPDRASRTLAQKYSGQVLDVTGLLIDEMKRVAGQTNLPWDLVRSADAAQQGSRDAQGLHALVSRVLPMITERIDNEVFETTGGGPLVLTELSPLARYGHLGVVARWSDLAARRARGVWTVLPQLSWMRGALVDGKPLQLGSNGQFVELNGDWLATQETEQHEQDDMRATEGIK